MKKCLAICIYLLLITAFLRFDIRLLFDARQLFLVVFGAALLYLPALGGKQKKFHFDRTFFGQNSLWASIIQTFVLLFVVLSEGQSREEMMMQTAMACRPLLYGFCLWVIFSKEAFDMTGQESKQDAPEEIELKTHTPEEIEDLTDNDTEAAWQKERDYETGMTEETRHPTDNSTKTQGQTEPPYETDLTKESKIFTDNNAIEKGQNLHSYETIPTKESEIPTVSNSTEKEQKASPYQTNLTKNSEIPTVNHSIEKEQQKIQEQPEETKKEPSKLFTKNDKNGNTKNEAAREHLAGLGLTKREIEVALLAAASLSNAEIAAELFISETTVKKHLSNIYGKLGISKRGQIRELF